MWLLCIRSPFPALQKPHPDAAVRTCIVKSSVPVLHNLNRCSSVVGHTSYTKRRKRREGCMSGSGWREPFPMLLNCNHVNWRLKAKEIHVHLRLHRTEFPLAYPLTQLFIYWFYQYTVTLALGQIVKSLMLFTYSNIAMRKIPTNHMTYSGGYLYHCVTDSLAERENRWMSFFHCYYYQTSLVLKTNTNSSSFSIANICKCKASRWVLCTSPTPTSNPLSPGTQ